MILGLAIFFQYYSYNFEYLGLKKLITIYYKNHDMNLFSIKSSEKLIYLEYLREKDNGRVPTIETIGIKELKGDGDFRFTFFIFMIFPVKNLFPGPISKIILLKVIFDFSIILFAIFWSIRKFWPNFF